MVKRFTFGFAVLGACCSECGIQLQCDLLPAGSSQRHDSESRRLQSRGQRQQGDSKKRQVRRGNASKSREQRRQVFEDNRSPGWTQVEEIRVGGTRTRLVFEKNGVATN